MDNGTVNNLSEFLNENFSSDEKRRAFASVILSIASDMVTKSIDDNNDVQLHDLHTEGNKDDVHVRGIASFEDSSLEIQFQSTLINTDPGDDDDEESDGD